MNTVDFVLEEQWFVGEPDALRQYPLAKSDQPTKLPTLLNGYRKL
jgi:hypothetical protein